MTGSKYLLETGNYRVLIDAGLFQGPHDLRQRNWQSLPVPPASLDAVVLTHAHIDHSGYLPRLVAEGFKGRIFCTAGTLELCSVVLPDAGRLQEEDARDANRGGYTKHSPALPLFRESDAFRAISQLQPVGYSRPVPVAPSVEIEFINAGHLLGSSFVRMTLSGSSSRQILFGGDLGRYDRPVLPDPTSVPEADVLLLESTYGDRSHEVDDDGERLAAVVRATAERGGKLIIPAFAIGRVEEVIYWIDRLERAQRIPSLPVFVDSPMAIAALKYYEARRKELDLEVPNSVPAAGRRGRVAGMCAFCTARFQTVASARSSQELVASHVPSIIISSSGMATGGRVLHHLKKVLLDPRHTVLFVGFQAAGTRGRLLVDGAPTVKIHGQIVPVSARIERLDSMSAHADSTEILRWLSGFSRPPAVTYLVHGEPAPMDTLKGAIERHFHWKVHTPEYQEQVDLE